MGLNILIADDSATSRGYLQKNLTLAEIPEATYWFAKNGKEAYQILQTERIDFLFLDINMPEMSGIEVVEKLFVDGLMTKVKVFVISTEGNEGRINRLKDLGIIRFLRKPFTPELFSEIIKKAI